RLRRRPLLRVAATLATAGAVAVAAVPAARTSLLEALGLRGVHVERIDSLPPTRARGQLSLGRPVSLTAARKLASFRLSLPATGAPDRVFVGNTVGTEEAVPEGVVSLVYGHVSRPRLLVQEFIG